MSLLGVIIYYWVNGDKDFISLLTYKWFGPKCEQCGKYFTQLSKVRKHIKMVHIFPLSIYEKVKDKEFFFITD